MSEPGSGSDVVSLQCARWGRRRVRDQRPKTWISEARYADNILLVCRTDDSGAKHDGISIFVPRTPGMEIRPIETMGGEVVNDVFFSDCRVPAENLLGTENQGWVQLTAGLNIEAADPCRDDARRRASVGTFD